MTAKRIPVPGAYAVPSESHPGVYAVYGPDGNYWARRTADELGITVPEPRTGRLKLNEDDTRAMARDEYVTEHRLADRAWNASVLICKEDVAEWDAADAAATRPPTPLGLSEDDVRTLALEATCHPRPLDCADRSDNAIIVACRQWVADVDGTES